VKVYEWGRRGDPPVLYWDGLGGTGLHANEIGPILAADHGLHVIAPDPPGHGLSPAPEADGFRPSRLAETAGGLLTELGVERAAFVGFSWGGRVGCWFAARYPERTTCLALVEGGHRDAGRPTGLEAALAEARAEREDDTFGSWDAYLAYIRDSVGRWTPELEAAHRAIMVEENGRVAPVLSAASLAAIQQGSRLEPVAEAYPAIAAAGVPVLLVVASELDREPLDRFSAALPEARVETIAAGVHDLVSFAPDEVARLVGELVSAQPPP